MSLYEEAKRLADSSYSFETLCHKVAKLLGQDNVYIAVDDVQAIWINKYEDHITITIYLISIEVYVKIYKDDNRIYTSIDPIISCECGGE